MDELLLREWLPTATLLGVSAGTIFRLFVALLRGHIRS
jgi:hypothetical protein